VVAAAQAWQVLLGLEVVGVDLHMDLLLR
jgi:hypothetical protein